MSIKTELFWLIMWFIYGVIALLVPAGISKVTFGAVWGMLLLEKIDNVARKVQK